MIQAFPDQEFDRLQRTVLEMPINNPDSKNERFPKELSRRLFPKYSDPDAKEILERSITSHCRVDLSIPYIPSSSNRSPSHHRQRPSSFVDPTPSRGTFPIPPPPSSSRKHPSPVAVEDEPEEPLPSRPIERERKPYSAQPGGGKVYDDSPKHRASSLSRGHAAAHDDHYTPRGGRARSPSTGVAGRRRYRQSENEFHGYRGGNSGAGGAAGTTAAATYGSSDRSPSSTDDFENIRYRDVVRDRERDEGRDIPRERARDRERGRRYSSSRGSWDSEEEYYRNNGLLGGKGGGYR